MTYRETRSSHWGWCVLAAATALAGCGGEEQVSLTGREGKMVYVDTVTKKATIMDVADTFPVTQPRTGKRTLMPAMYCSKCDKWHSVPPLDQINRTPRATQCPKTGAPLTVEGPWPEEGEEESRKADRSSRRR